MTNQTPLKDANVLGETVSGAGPATIALSGVGEQRVAGRVLDAEIAERVFGFHGQYKYLPAYPRHYTDPELPEHHQETPHYSTDIAAAWLVVEKLRDDGYRFGLRYIGWWYADFFGAQFVNPSRDRPNLYATDPGSAPLAICRAALASSPDKPIGALSSAGNPTPSPENPNPVAPHETEAPR